MSASSFRIDPFIDADRVTITVEEQPVLITESVILQNSNAMTLGINTGLFSEISTNGFGRTEIGSSSRYTLMASPSLMTDDTYRRVTTEVASLEHSRIQLMSRIPFRHTRVHPDSVLPDGANLRVNISNTGGTMNAGKSISVRQEGGSAAIRLYPGDYVQFPGSAKVYQLGPNVGSVAFYEFGDGITGNLRLTTPIVQARSATSFRGTETERDTFYGTREQEGDIWVDSTDDATYVYDGTVWSTTPVSRTEHLRAAGSARAADVLIGEDVAFKLAITTLPAWSSSPGNNDLLWTSAGAFEFEEVL